MQVTTQCQEKATEKGYTPHFQQDQHPIQTTVGKEKKKSAHCF